MTVFQTSAPEAAFRTYTVRPAAKYTWPPTTVAEETMSPPSVPLRSGSVWPAARHCGGMGRMALSQSTWNFQFTAPVAASSA
jgi:hypothetical protein